MITILTFRRSEFFGGQPKHGPVSPGVECCGVFAEQVIDSDNQHADVRRPLAPQGCFAAVAAFFDDLPVAAGTDGNDLVTRKIAAKFIEVVEQPLQKHCLFFAAVAIRFIHHQDHRLLQRKQPFDGLAFIACQVAVANVQHELGALRFLDGDRIEIAIQTAGSRHIGQQDLRAAFVAPAIVADVERRPANRIDDDVCVGNQRLDKRALASTDFAEKTQVHGPGCLAGSQLLQLGLCLVDPDAGLFGIVQPRLDLGFVERSLRGNGSGDFSTYHQYDDQPNRNHDQRRHHGQISVQNDARTLHQAIPDIECRLRHEQQRRNRDDEDQQHEQPDRDSDKPIHFHAGYTTCMNRRNRRTVVLVVALLVAACSAPGTPEYATLVVKDARVWTGSAEQPWAEAIAVRDNTIVAVGSAADVDALIGDDTDVISVEGSMLVPGFIDTHVHFISGGSGLASVQLRDAATPAEFTSRIGEFAKTVDPGEWIMYGDWDHTLWGGELPRRDWIDDVTPDNPVWVYRLDGHMALANSAALALAGVDADSADIDGGTIVRYPDGRPTGILKDNAMTLVEQAIPEATAAKLDREARAAMEHVAGNGVTSVHDMAGWQSLATYRRAHERGDMITRIYSVVPLRDWQRLRDDVAVNGTGDQWLRTGGLKGFMDGSLGSHTAAMLEPFTDAPEDKGFLINPLDDMRTWVVNADAAGLQVMVHAIGDSAIRDLLDIYLDAVEANGNRDRRFRMEHAQHIHPDDIARFAAQDVIASMQPYHAIDDGRWAEDVIGPERAKTTYAFRSLIDAGAKVSFGSDWSVAPATPIDGIYAAVTRRTLDGANRHGWVPEQKISVEQALHAYTTVAAYASFEENLKGMLRPGMLADFVLLDRDLTAIPAEAIRDTRVLKTVLDGKVVYSRN